MERTPVWMPPWSMKEMLALAPIFDMDVSKVGLLVASCTVLPKER